MKTSEIIGNKLNTDVIDNNPISDFPQLYNEVMSHKQDPQVKRLRKKSKKFNYYGKDSKGYYRM